MTKKKLTPLALLKRRFLKDEGGATAIEFGLIGPVFFAMMFGIMELAMIYFAQQQLEQALHDAARTVMTGQIVNADGTYSADGTGTLKQRVCSRIFGLIDCNRLSVELRTYGTFAASRAETTQNRYQTLAQTPTETTPTTKGNQIVTIRAVFAYPMFFASFLPMFAEMEVDGRQRRVLIAVRSFRNEPY